LYPFVEQEVKTVVFITAQPSLEVVPKKNNEKKMEEVIHAFAKAKRLKIIFINADFK
jgi:DNA-binding MurR/RpiR family transcriptional regulator